MMRTLIAALLTLFFTCPLMAGDLPDSPHIVVIGEYQQEFVPDQLVLGLSLSEVGFEVKEAQQEVEQRAGILINTLKEMGVAEKDINAAQLQITPHYNWQNNSQIYAGTEVSRNLTITLRQLGNYDAMLRQILDAQVARIDRTELLLTNEKQARQEIMQGALADARNKAELLASALDEKLGGIYAITPAQGPQPFLEARFMADKHGGQSAFTPGTITLSESLRVVFFLTK